MITQNIRKYLPALLVLLIVEALHMLGNYHQLYFYIRWYDIPVHFLGGLWIGLTAVWFLDVFFDKEKYSFARSLIWVLSITLSFAVAWEFFETASGLTSPRMLNPLGMSYLADTIKDIAMGMLGGTVAFITYHWRNCDRR